MTPTRSSRTSNRYCETGQTGFFTDTVYKHRSMMVGGLVRLGARGDCFQPITSNSFKHLNSEHGHVKLVFLIHSELDV